MLSRVSRVGLGSMEPLSNSIHSYQKFNRFFDSVSLRYFYESGERHELTPKGDETAIAQVSEQNGDETGATAGVSGAIPSGIAPSLGVHVQSNRSITVGRQMKSWRYGLSYEPCE